jgi:hypothetical protein
VAKIEKKIGLWCNQWLSIGGRLILVKTVLESQSVFWMSMEMIPKSVLNRIRQLMFEFMWSGQKATHHFHLCRWDLLARPKHCGGWGLRNLATFNSAYWKIHFGGRSWSIAFGIEFSWTNTWGKLRWSTGSVKKPTSSREYQAFGAD